MGQFDGIVSLLFADLRTEPPNLLDHEPLHWARQYLDLADHLFERGQKLLAFGDKDGGSGDLQRGALFMWRSYLCAIIAVAQKADCPTETYEDLTAVTEVLVNELEEPVLINGFEAAKVVRCYGRQSTFIDGDLDTAWVSTTKFLRRLLELAG